MAAYQVLARKFRPNKFADVVGQTHVTRTLQNAMKQGRIPHAFLFTGTRGCGKTTTARILAKALNCTSEKQPPSEPCNKCENCTEIASGGSLDVLEIDGASNNGVENIRELRENVRFMPNRGRFKIYIIDETHMLSTAAWNALLKTLEEPPDHVIFMFATTEPQKVPQTILSRCQRFDFKRISTHSIADRLQKICKAEKVKVTPAGFISIAQTAGGSLRDAESLLDQVISYAGREIGDEAVTEVLGLIDRTLPVNLLNSLADRSAAGTLQVARKVAEGGYDAEVFAKEVLSRIRDLMIVKVLEDPGDFIEAAADEIEELQKISDTFSRGEIDALYTLLADALDDLRGDSPYLALEMALLRMSTVEPLASVEDLAERLAAVADGHKLPPPTSPSGGGRGVRAPKQTPPETRSGHNKDESSHAAPEAPVPAATSPAAEANEDKSTLPMDWKGFETYVRQRGGFLGTYLAKGWMADYDGKTLTVGIEAGSLAETRLSEQTAQQELTGYLQAFLHNQAQVKVVPGAGPPPRTRPPEKPATRTSKDVIAAHQADQRKALREEALDDPDIARTMDKLGAELSEVQPLRSGS